MNQAIHSNISEASSDIVEGMHNLDNFGMTIHKNFLSADQVTALKNRLDEQAEQERRLGLASFAYAESDESNGRIVGDAENELHVGRPKSIPPLQAVLTLVNKGRVFIDLAMHPAALAYANHLFQDVPFIIGTQVGIIMRKGVPALSLHQDQHFMPFATPRPVLLNIMVALSDYEEDMGSTDFVPGTHKTPYSPTDLNARKTVPIVMKPGWAALWESRLVHGRREHRSEKTRCSISTTYQYHFIREAGWDYRAIVDAEVYNSLTPEERALYDYGNVRGGFNLKDRDKALVQNEPAPTYIPALYRN